LNYLKNIINSQKELTNDKQKKIEDEPLDILKECYDVLYLYIFEPKKLAQNFKEKGKDFV
jgi:hypothetical protein